MVSGKHALFISYQCAKSITTNQELTYNHLLENVF